MAATANITIPTAAAADVANAPAGMYRLFLNSSNSNKLSTKDSAGVVAVVGEGGAPTTLQEAYEAGGGGSSDIALVVGRALNIGGQLADGDAPVTVTMYGSEGFSPTAAGPGNDGGAWEGGGGNGGDSPDDVGGTGALGELAGGSGGNGTTGGPAGVARVRGGKGGDSTVGAPAVGARAELIGGEGGSTDVADEPAAIGGDALVEGGQGGEGADAPNNGQGGSAYVRGGLAGTGTGRAPVYLQDQGDPEELNQVNSGSGATTFSHAGLMRSVPLTVSYDAGSEAYGYDVAKSNVALVTVAHNDKPLVFTSVSSALQGASGFILVTHDGANTDFSSWGASGGTVRYVGGVKPVLSVGNGARDLLRWDLVGDTVYLTLVGLAYAEPS